MSNPFEPRFGQAPPPSQSVDASGGGPLPANGSGAGSWLDSSLSDMVSAYEKCLIEEALRATRGNRAKAARLLRTTERILGYRIQQYDIDWKRFRC